MDAFTLEELSAATAEQANTLEMLPGQERFANPVTYEQANETIEVTNTWSRVIRSGGEVVGFVRAYFDPDYATEELRCCVWRVSVSANAQGKGVGHFAIEAVKQAQAALNKERVKLDAMRDLIKDERRKIAVAEERALAKALDDLAGAKFVRSLRQATPG